MGKDVLVILMIAFGLFAVIMFVLFYAYLKKYYNNKHIDYNYERDNLDDDDGEDIIDNPPQEENNINEVNEEKEENYYSKKSSEPEYNASNIEEYNIDYNSEDEDLVPIKKE